MNEWKITTPNGMQMANAMKSHVTPNGDLVFSHQDGELLLAFAKGSWLVCEQVKAASRGYGG